MKNKVLTKLFSMDEEAQSDFSVKIDEFSASTEDTMLVGDLELSRTDEPGVVTVTDLVSTDCATACLQEDTSYEFCEMAPATEAVTLGMSDDESKNFSDSETISQLSVTGANPKQRQDLMGFLNTSGMIHTAKIESSVLILSFTAPVMLDKVNEIMTKVGLDTSKVKMQSAKSFSDIKNSYPRIFSKGKGGFSALSDEDNDTARGIMDKVQELCRKQPVNFGPKGPKLQWKAEDKKAANDLLNEQASFLKSKGVTLDEVVLFSNTGEIKVFCAAGETVWVDGKETKLTSGEDAEGMVTVEGSEDKLSKDAISWEAPESDDEDEDGDDKEKEFSSTQSIEDLEKLLNEAEAAIEEHKKSMPKTSGPGSSEWRKKKDQLEDVADAIDRNLYAARGAGSPGSKSFSEVEDVVAIGIQAPNGKASVVLVEDEDEANDMSAFMSKKNWKVLGQGSEKDMQKLVDEANENQKDNKPRKFSSNDDATVGSLVIGKGAFDSTTDLDSAKQMIEASSEGVIFDDNVNGTGVSFSKGQTMTVKDLKKILGGADMKKVEMYDQNDEAVKTFSEEAAASGTMVHKQGDPVWKEVDGVMIQGEVLEPTENSEGEIQFIFNEVAESGKPEMYKWDNAGIEVRAKEEPGIQNTEAKTFSREGKTFSSVRLKSLKGEWEPSSLDFSWFDSSIEDNAHADGNREGYAFYASVDRENDSLLLCKNVEDKWVITYMNDSDDFLMEDQKDMEAGIARFKELTGLSEVEVYMPGEKKPKMFSRLSEGEVFARDIIVAFLSKINKSGKNYGNEFDEEIEAGSGIGQYFEALDPEELDFLNEKLEDFGRTVKSFSNDFEKPAFNQSDARMFSTAGLVDAEVKAETAVPEYVSALESQLQPVRRFDASKDVVEGIELKISPEAMPESEKRKEDEAKLFSKNKSEGTQSLSTLDALLSFFK